MSALFWMTFVNNKIVYFKFLLSFKQKHTCLFVSNSNSKMALLTLVYGRKLASCFLTFETNNLLVPCNLIYDIKWSYFLPISITKESLYSNQITAFWKDSPYASCDSLIGSLLFFYSQLLPELLECKVFKVKLYIIKWYHATLQPKPVIMLVISSLLSPQSFRANLKTT